MAEVLTPDICVIGAGSGGIAVAAGAAAFGVPVVLIERGTMGGASLNRSALPSKALLAAARRAHLVEDAGRFGIKAQRPKIDFLDAHAHVENVIRTLAPNSAKERLAGLGVNVIAGSARFEDRRTVSVGDRYEIRARRFVIATGSSPAIPAIPGLSQCPYLTGDTAFELAQCPRHLVVVGGGPTGIEAAQAYRRLGAEVTVLEAGVPLAQDDPECTAVVLDRLAREGVVIRTGVKIARVEKARARVRVMLGGSGGEETIEASHILVATGRVANVDGLGLDAAGIIHEPRGIRVNRLLRTSNRKVYAVGDVVLGSPQFTHVATHHAGLVIRSALLRLSVDASRAALPRIIGTDPELAHVGLSEQEARKLHKSIRVLRWPLQENDRAVAEAETAGHCKIVTAKNGRVLGATLVGARASELIALWALAIGRGLTVGAIADTVIPYPSLTEIGRSVAASFSTPGLTNPWTRRIIGFLRRFG